MSARVGGCDRATRGKWKRPKWWSYIGIMKTISTALSKLSDRELLCEVKRLAHNERQATSELIASLAELDVRRLYLGEGHPSLFVYCTAVLRLSESAAYHRIQVARAAQRFPVIVAQLAEGAITLTTVALLAPHLTNENLREVLDAARHKSRREVEHLVARLAPRPDVPSIVRGGAILWFLLLAIRRRRWSVRPVGPPTPSGRS
jgi:hypothetical protein